jgi:RNA polymerase sigma factor (sigma-70 family)
MQQSDPDLVSACRRGDPLAWEKLIQRYQRLIYTIPRRAGLDEDQSAEVFQEVFTTLFQKLGDIEEPERLQAWLVTTARRKTWRTICKEKAWQPTEPTHEVGVQKESSIPDDAPLPDEQLIILEEQHRIRVGLESLDERCKKLLELLFYAPEPPSYAEIAILMGTSEGSIGPTRARCLEKLLRILNK